MKISEIGNPDDRHVRRCCTAVTISECSCCFSRCRISNSKRTGHLRPAPCVQPAHPDAPDEDGRVVPASLASVPTSQLPSSYCVPSASTAPPFSHVHRVRLHCPAFARGGVRPGYPRRCGLSAHRSDGALADVLRGVPSCAQSFTRPARPLPSWRRSCARGRSTMRSGRRELSNRNSIPRRPSSIRARRRSMWFGPRLRSCWLSCSALCPTMPTRTIRADSTAGRGRAGAEPCR